MTDWIRSGRTLAFMLLLGIAGSHRSGAQVSSGNKTSEGIPVGQPLAFAIQSGDSYSSYAELYEGQIVVLQVTRGEKAWDLIKEANATNKPPASGMEYLVAKIRFSYSTKSEPGNKSFLLRENMFTAFAENGKEYDPVSIAYPKVNLDTKLFAGDAVEGWVAFHVSKADAKPSMTFGNGRRFQIY